MLKILYVEDEPFLGKIVKESLESRQFQVEMIADGQLVMATFERFSPDVCVLDVMLPNVDGFTLGKNIREKSPLMPILFLTAKTQTQDVLQGFESGGNDYIRKPFSMEELIVRIQNLAHLANLKVTNLASKTEMPVFESIAIGDFTFLPHRYEIKYGDIIRKLSHREAELLKILNENRHFVVNRKDILLKIWGDDSFFNSRTLDVYITKLRDYFKNSNATTQSVEIVTIKGVGYIFRVA